MVNSIKSATIALLICSSAPLLAQRADLPPVDEQFVLKEPDRAIINEIVHHAQIIEELLLLIKNAEQAEELMPRLQFHYDAIARKIPRANELIDTEHSDIIIVQRFRRGVAQQFGRLSIYCMRIWQSGAYGNDELKQFVAQFCPKQKHQGRLQGMDGIRSMRVPLVNFHPPALENIESALFELYETLQQVKSLETAEQHAEKIEELIAELQPSYGETRELMKNAKSELERQMLDRRMESIRHIGAICRAEMVRVREASYFKESALAHIIQDPYEGMEKLKKQHQ